MNASVRRYEQQHNPTDTNLVVALCVSLHFQQIRAGTTAVVVFLRGKTLYVGWLGDSQAFLVRKDKPVSLVEPHKPDREVRLLIMPCHVSSVHALVFHYVG